MPATSPPPEPPADLLLVAAHAVLPEGDRPAVVVVRGGRIDAVLHPDDPRPPAVATVELAPDEVLLPGLVDSHVHANDPGRTSWEGLRSLTTAAALGGITTVVDMPLNCLPPTVDAAGVDAKLDACPDPAVDVATWGGAVPDRLDDLPGLLDAGVLGLKAFMVDSGTEEFAGLTDDAGLERAMRAVAQADLPLLVHAEDAGVCADAPRAHPTAYAGLLAARPVAAETVAIARLIALARRTGAHVHVVHVTSEEGVRLLRDAQQDGVAISGETCPHYLALDAAELPDGDPRVKCFPPIRGRRHQDALWAGLADGTLCAVVSDHSPAPWALKDTGDLATAWGGIASLQIGLPVVWTAARRRGVPLTEVVRWMAAGPAAIAGLDGRGPLPRKGAIVAGADADLVAFAPDATLVVRGAELAHRHPETPYEGRELHGVVRATWLRGRDVSPAAPHGAWLLRPPTKDDHPVRHRTITATTDDEAAGDRVAARNRAADDRAMTGPEAVGDRVAAGHGADAGRSSRGPEHHDDPLSDAAAARAALGGGR
ncbi:allantoinase AllB [Patulibacter sp. NPDC049589]|uniref:allantoinase AllB n=1 Tax=Patulibacter sp. NPDC049589 TaxID=3154731 RepID=UPI00342F41D4